MAHLRIGSAEVAKRGLTDVLQVRENSQLPWKILADTLKALSVRRIDIKLQLGHLCQTPARPQLQVSVLAGLWMQCMHKAALCNNVQEYLPKARLSEQDFDLLLACGELLL